MMAEVTDHNPVGNDGNKGDSSVDHSVAKPRATKKVPHYLRASTGSCHDACKYGHPHKSKDKPTRLPRRRMSLPLPDGANAVEIQIFVDNKVQKTLKSDKLELPSAKQSAPAQSRTKKILTMSRKSPVHDSSKLIKQEAAKSFNKSPSPDPPKVVKKAVQSLGKSNLPDTLKTSKKQGVPSAVKKDASSKRIPLNTKERSVAAGPLKPSARGEKLSSSLDSSTRSSGKKIKETKICDNPRTARVSIKKTAAPPTATKVDLKKLSLPTTAGKGLNDPNRRSKTFAKKQMLGSKAEPMEPADEKVEEKTVIMIETKEDHLSTDAPDASLLVRSPTPLSPESLNSSSGTITLSFTSQEVDDQCALDMEYTDSEADGSISDYNSSADSKAASDSLNERKELTHKGHNSKDVDPVSFNLKFRKGKVVEPPSETNSTRRLRFRQGRTLGDGEGTNGVAQRKSYRKKAAESDKAEAKTGLVNVVLKHQEMETKKEEQVLLNNVIEETASKLVEKRKSKVKALVGAFETVISLQERKPSATDT